MISLIIPTNGTNRNYTNNLISNIEYLYSNGEVEVIVEENNEINLCTNYNNAVEKAKGEKIILLHNDMILSKGFVELMDKHIQKGRITTYTRVEPPIYNDVYPGKVILNCGSNLEEFDENAFESIKLEESLVDGGSQLFFGCMKEDYIKLDEKTFNPPAMWCSDDDFHLRCELIGLERKVSSAHVYHFVSKTSRTTDDYKEVEMNSNRNFIRKWGFRISTSKTQYDVGFEVKNCNLDLLHLLEPWCSSILIDDEMQVLTTHYIDEEQKHTSFNLSKRILTTPFQKLSNYIIVKIDRKTFTQEDFNNIQMLSDIVYNTEGEEGDYELGNLLITVGANIN